MPRKQFIKCYFGCDNDFPLHRFPNPKSINIQELSRFRSWVSVLDPEILEKGESYIYNSVKLCDNHFEEFYKSPSKRLTRNAVPTLHLDKSTESYRNVAPKEGIIDKMTPVINEPPCPSTSQLPASTTITSTTVNDTQAATKKKIENQYKKSINRLESKLQRLSKKFKSQKNKIQAARNLSLRKSFLTIMESFPDTVKTFVKMQLKSTKKPRGRRFTLKEKVLALTILKQSPKAYNLLKKDFTLPSKRVLQKLIGLFKLLPGINNDIFENLRKTCAKMPEEKKFVNIIFDEISISPGVEFVASQKKIVGFEDLGSKRNKVLANHALVFMLKGVKGKFKQPICYTFCRGTTKAQDLKDLLTKIIKEVTRAGFKIISTVCDQSATNVKVIKSMIEETRENHRNGGEDNYSSLAFEIDNIKVFPLFNPPHLLKGVRNNLLKKNAVYFDRNGIKKVAKWDHLKMLLNVDVGEDEIRLVNKLTETHLLKEKLPKMKVKYAAQVFSQRVSAALRFLARHKILPAECEETADFLLMFDKLFDSFNGHSYQMLPKQYRTALKHNSPHFQLWTDLLPVLETIKFQSIVKRNGVEIIKNESVPSIKNWIHNIKVFNEIWVHVNQIHNLNNLLTRNFNQDPLENFFSSIRSNGVRNVNPNCNQFSNSYKTLIINNFSSCHSLGANCEGDNDKPIQSLMNLLDNKSTCPPLYCDSDYACQIDNLLIAMAEIRNDDKLLHAESKKYVSGYVIKKCKSQIFKNCKTCMRDLCRSNVDCQSFIYEVDNTKKSLFHPNDKFNDLMNDIYFFIVACLRDFPEADDLNDKIKYLLNCACNYSFISCIKHKNLLIDYINELAIKLIIHSWCKGVNQLLNGKFSKFDMNDPVKQDAFNYYKKRRK